MTDQYLFCYSRVEYNIPGKSREQEFKIPQSMKYNSWGLEKFSIYVLMNRNDTPKVSPLFKFLYYAILNF